MSDTIQSSLARPAPPDGRASLLTACRLIEPAQCVPPIRDLWRNANKMGLNRAIANVVVQRLRPDLSNEMPWPLSTTAMGRAQLCYIYPTIPPQGHWFTLAKGTCDEVAIAAAEQTDLPHDVRAEIVLLAVWRPQRTGADRRLHLWAIPDHFVAIMAKRLDAPGTRNRNVGINPPLNGRPSVWRKGKNDSAPLALQDNYHCWTLSDAELAHMLDAERSEIRIRKRALRRGEQEAF